MEHVIFLSYRRMDTSGHAGRISNDLGRCFGNSVMFRDINSIGPGVDFVQALEQAIQSARVCLVLIGDTWLTETAADGERRLDSPDDHVRREIEMALDKEGLKVIPLLVEGAHMPDEDDLPVSIQKLARLQAVELSESRWDYDMARLVTVLGATGIGQRFYQRLSRNWRFMSLVVLLAVIAVPLYFWRAASAVDVYRGLWYLPNGSYWSVEEKDTRWWVDETHFDSHQVWKQGPADIVDGELQVQLALVFKPTEPPFLYRLRLSMDRQSLVGSVRRSGRPAGEESLVLRRKLP
jgi:hypothetical protein